jgi:hypothetical protein
VKFFTFDEISLNNSSLLLLSLSHLIKKCASSSISLVGKFLHNQYVFIPTCFNIKSMRWYTKSTYWFSVIEIIYYSNMTSFKRFESKPVVKIIYTYTHCNLWCHRQVITIFYQFLHIRIEIIHGSHMYILFLPRVSLYVSFLPLANARGKTSWHIKAYPW